MVMSYSSSKSFNHKPLNPNTMKYLDTFTLDLVQNGDTIIERDGFYSTHLSQWKDKLTELELYVQILKESLRNNDCLIVTNSVGEYDILGENELHNDVLELLNH